MTPYKQIVLDVLINFEYDAGTVYVTKGRGTGSRWIHVKSTKPINENIKNVIKLRLNAAGILSYYAADDGNEYPCISFVDQWISI